MGILALDAQPLGAAYRKLFPLTICGETRFACGKQSGAAQSTSIARSRDLHSSSYKPTGLTMILRSRTSWPVVPKYRETKAFLKGKGKIQAVRRIKVHRDSQNSQSIT